MGKILPQLPQRKLMPYRKQIQIIFQDPYSALNPRMSIGEIIREGMVTLKWVHRIGGSRIEPFGSYFSKLDWRRSIFTDTPISFRVVSDNG